MPWLWNSWEEYRDWVHPSSIRRGFWGLSHQQTWNEAESKLWDAVHRLTESRNSLCKLGFTGSDDDFPPDSPADLSRVRHLVITVIHCGETLLLYHKRLAKSEASYGFLHQIDLLEHWDRYASTGRIASEIHQLVTDLRDLLQGYEAFLRAEDKFIIGGLDLPTSLESDFLLARNLFSVGFDDVGLLIAGRGLEGVLRKIAHDRKILLEIKGKAAPASESDFFDLIETMYHVRWKTKKTRFLSSEMRALMHFLRTLRNGGAHAAIQGSRFLVNPREAAALIAESANELWRETRTRARLTPNTIQKNW
jgi:hypothetical protein